MTQATTGIEGDDHTMEANERSVYEREGSRLGRDSILKEDALNHLTRVSDGQDQTHCGPWATEVAAQTFDHPVTENTGSGKNASTNVSTNTNRPVVKWGARLTHDDIKSAKNFAGSVEWEHYIGARVYMAMGKFYSNENGNERWYLMSGWRDKSRVKYSFEMIGYSVELINMAGSVGFRCPKFPSGTSQVIYGAAVFDIFEALLWSIANNASEETIAPRIHSIKDTRENA